MGSEYCAAAHSTLRTASTVENPYPVPILDILVPQTGQDPCVAFLPFLKVTALGLRISRLVLHLKQYAFISPSGWSCVCTIYHFARESYSRLAQQSLSGQERSIWVQQPGMTKKAATFRKGTIRKFTHCSPSPPR